MTQTMMALYDRPERADQVVELLRTQGFESSKLQIFPGNIWLAKAAVSDEQKASLNYAFRGNEIVLVLPVTEPHTGFVRELLCNSPAVDVRIKEGDLLAKGELTAPLRAQN